MPATLYGHAIDSDVPLSRARDGAAPRGRLAVRTAEAEPPRSGEEVVRREDRFTIHRDGGRLVVWCEGSGTFAVDPAAGRIDAAPSAAEPAEWEHRLACVVVPLLLAERGDLALHAAAVRTAAGAVAFCGDSGAGKSTTAWALARRGYEVLAEDGCVIDAAAAAPHVWPGLAGVRLRDASGARPVELGGGASADPVPLHAVVLLQPRGGAEPSLEPVDPAAALTALMPHGVHALGPSQAAVFRGSAALARGVPVFRGRLPDDLERAGEHAEALLDRVRLSGSSRASTSRP